MYTLFLSQFCVTKTLASAYQVFIKAIVHTALHLLTQHTLVLYYELFAFMTHIL